MVPTRMEIIEAMESLKRKTIACRALAFESINPDDDIKYYEELITKYNERIASLQVLLEEST